MSSFALKITAIVLMTLDHFATIAGQLGIIALIPGAGLDSAWALNLSYGILLALNGLGRAAFPLFAFMLAEGCARTRSMPRYMGRLALFALISEPVYYFTLGGAVYGADLGGFIANIAGLNFNNIFFTLALAALAIYAWQRLTPRGRGGAALGLLAFALAAFAAGYFKTDYGAMGVILIFALYLAGKSRKLQCAVIVLWALVLYFFSGFGYGWYDIGPWQFISFFGACLSLIPVLLSSGRRGRPLKWAFYIYYPAHLAVLGLMAALLH